MADFQYYASFAESLDLLRAVVEEHQFVIVPFPATLEEAQTTSYTEVNEALRKALMETPRVLLGGAFSKEPLRFSQVETLIFLEEGYGQRLTWNLSRERSKADGRLVIYPGSLSYLSMYRDPVTEALEPANAELQAAYKAVVASLKKRCVKVTIRKRDAIWVGRKTNAAVARGELVIDR